MNKIVKAAKNAYSGLKKSFPKQHAIRIGDASRIRNGVKTNPLYQPPVGKGGNNPLYGTEVRILQRSPAGKHVYQPDGNEAFVKVGVGMLNRF